MHAERLDALVTFAGCDKSLPGMLMAAARLNLPSVFLYGGSILPGHYKDQALDIVSVFEAVGACAAGHDHRERARRDRDARVPDRGLVRGHVHRQHDGVGRRGARHVAARARRRRPRSTAAATTSRTSRGRAVMHLLELDIRPRQIMTKEAFENAIAVVMALGGSTNAVLHLLAIAYEARVELELDDFNRIGARVPHIADMKPHGKYHMTDLDRVGGVPVVMQELLDAGLLHGDCLTVTGKTMAENLADARPAGARRRRRAPARRPDPRAGRHRGPPRLARAEGQRREGRRASTIAASTAPPACSTARTLAMEAILAGQDQARRHRRDPLRGPEGRPGHARDARGHRRDEGRRPRRRRRARHRRPLLRRHARLLRRATSRPRRSTAARSRSSPTATAS